jgi:hypothetical protein
MIFNQQPENATMSQDTCQQCPETSQRAGEGTRTPNLLFLCGWYRRALAGWHRLASGLVRLRKDTHCLRSPCDRWAGKCGGKCGVSVPDRLRVIDVHGSDDSFRVSRDPRAFGSCAERTERPPEYQLDRSRSNRLVSSLVSRRGDNQQTVLLVSALRRIHRMLSA